MKETRRKLGLTQIKLARLSGVSRYRICLAEAGDINLREDEQDRIRETFVRTVEHLHGLEIAWVPAK